MRTYQDALDKLAGRDSRKIDNNTYLQRRGDKAIAVKLHATDVITFRENGDVVLDSGGWKTITTKDRMNAYGSVRVWSTKGIWYCSNGTAEAIPYKDGITFHADGTITGQGKDPNAELKMRRKVQAYAAKFTEQLKAGKIGVPTSGDCWYCLMRQTQGAGTSYGVLKSDGKLTNQATVKPGVTGATMGEIGGDTSHILDHIAHNYFVPSLVLRALEIYGSMAARETLMQNLHGEVGSPYSDFIYDQIRKTIARYCFGQLGMAGGIRAGGVRACDQGVTA